MTPYDKEIQSDIKAHEITKTICEKVENYWEAFYILEKAKEILERNMKSQKAETTPYPIDRFGKKIETPPDITPGA